MRPSLGCGSINDRCMIACDQKTVIRIMEEALESTFMRNSLLVLLTVIALSRAAITTRIFDVATYATVRDTVQMKDPAGWRARWEGMSKYTKFDKIYIETSRDMIVADQQSVDAGKKFFLSKGSKFPVVSLGPWTRGMGRLLLLRSRTTQKGNRDHRGSPRKNFN